MKMLYKLILSTVLILSMSSCGSDSEDSTSDNGISGQVPDYRVEVNGSPYRVSFPVESFAISNLHCVYINLYDLNGNHVSMYDNTNVNSKIPKGDYLLKVTRKFLQSPEYDDTKGAFYTLGTDTNISILSLDRQYQVPTRTRDIYKLIVDNNTTFLVTTDKSDINVYDENLSIVDYKASVFTLTKGEYYIHTQNYACSSADGSFSISVY